MKITSEEAFWPRAGVHDAKLIELMGIDQEEFSRRFKGSPVKRTKRRGLPRNVAVALGNWGSPAAVPVLSLALSDGGPLIRGHAAWALGQVASAAECPVDVRAECLRSIEERRSSELDGWVREELALASQVVGNSGTSPSAEG